MISPTGLTGDERRVALLGSESGDTVQAGLLERAHGGTLFMDEFTELDADSQAWHDRFAGTWVVKVPKGWPL